MTCTDIGEQCVCFFDSYCCDTEWDDTCAYYCGFCPGGCGSTTENPENGDLVDQLLAAAESYDASVGDVVSALKDRLVTNGAVATDEAELIEALIGIPLESPVEVEALEPGLRTLCGALLLSPEAVIARPVEIGATPTLVDTAADCDHLRGLVPDARCD